MTTLRTIVQGRRVAVDVPPDWPDGAEVEIHPIEPAPNGAATSVADAVSHAEFERILDELAASPTGAPSLPADFSRADIYAQHD